MLSLATKKKKACHSSLRANQGGWWTLKEPQWHRGSFFIREYIWVALNASISKGDANTERNGESVCEREPNVKAGG